MLTKMPELRADMSLSEAALVIASAGGYVIPLQPASKVPRYGFKWRADSTNDRAKVRALWRQEPNSNIGLDCGKSGVIVLDDDKPDLVPAEISAHLGKTARNWTSANKRRSHVFFLQPDADALFGNSPGVLARYGFDVRGGGGFVVMPPSVHPDALDPVAAELKHPGDHGRYSQDRAGRIRPLPEELTEGFSEAPEPVDDIDDAEIVAIMHQYDSYARPSGHNGALKIYQWSVDEQGLSRHDSARNALCTVFREGMAGDYALMPAVKALHALFVHSLREGESRPPGEGEWRGMVRYAAAHAKQADVPTTRAKARRGE